MVSTNNVINYQIKYTLNIKGILCFLKTERTLKLLSTRDNFRLTLILFLLCSTFQGILMSLNIAIQMDFFFYHISYHSVDPYY